jgi:tripartite-type tricarboxylate transporter receptor subunit TctC
MMHVFQRTAWYVLSLVLLLPVHAMAQTYPSRPISIVVPFSPATGIDLIARSMSAKLAERWNIGVVVDNRAGASANIGTEAAARSNPDGYTLLVTAATFVTNAAVNPNMRYDPIRSFVPVVLLATGIQSVAVSNATPARSIRELVALAKAQPGKLFYGSPGSGTPHHLAAELFKLETGTDIVHVPYKGFAGAINDLIGGRLNLMIMPVSAVAQYVQNRQISVLAVIHTERSPVFPAVPTLEQEGYPKVHASNWYAMLAPAGTPPEIIGRLNAEMNRLLSDSSVRDTLTKQGFTPVGGPPERLASQLRTELERWQQVAKEAGIKAD